MKVNDIGSQHADYQSREFLCFASQIDNRCEENCRRKLCRVTSALAEQISTICNTSIKILCSDAVSIFGLIRELKAFKFKHAALALDHKRVALFLGHTVYQINIPLTVAKFLDFYDVSTLAVVLICPCTPWPTASLEHLACSSTDFVSLISFGSNNHGMSYKRKKTCLQFVC